MIIESSADAPEGRLRKFSSLDEAFGEYKIPLENQVFIRQLLTRIPIVSIEGASGYVKVGRGDSKIAIQVASGYSNGFLAEEEITDSVGDVERWGSRRIEGTWGVTHPANSLRDGGTGATKTIDRDYGVCPSCYLGLPAMGVCGACGE